MADFLRNYWYVCAWHEELGRDILARTLCGEQAILFRQEDGTPVALEDRCCHRYVPLSQGKLIGGVVQCGYHGLEFDHTGACVRVPGQSKVPPGARVRSYPVVEKFCFVWIWMGNPAEADEAAIPDMSPNVRDGWTAAAE